MAAIKIAMLTANPRKAEEYQKAWGRYAIKPLIVDPWAGDLVDPSVSLAAGRLDALAAVLLDQGLTVVISEISNIHAPGAVAPLVEPRHMDLAVNRSTASLWRRSPDLEHHVYQREVQGYITHTAPISETAFMWDAFFAPVSTGLTYDQTSCMGLKNSARDLVLAEIFRDVLRFEQPVNLNFAPLDSVRLVDFTASPARHLTAHATLSSDAFKASPAALLLGTALQDGVFFRSSESRRERNYWLPGLNGGVPLVPKKDDIHEMSFQFHDLMHTLMPDLVFDGSTSEEARRVYMIHRMLGEAISLVAADAMFVDTLVQTGVDYDFSKRCIHPLFASMHAIDLHTESGFKAACRANAQYALLGDDSMLRALGADPAALDAYKGKYERFFTEDYRWTSANFERMTQDAVLFRQWSADIHDAIPAAHLTTLTDFQAHLAEQGPLDVYDLPGLLDRIFEACWEMHFQRIFVSGTHLYSATFDHNLAASNAFLRWVLGQLVMYVRYSHVPAVARMGEMLLAEVVQTLRSGLKFETSDIARLRAFHDRAVEHLFAQTAITDEERRIFKEVVPVFEPFFVFYETKGLVRDLNGVISELLPPLIP